MSGEKKPYPAHLSTPEAIEKAAYAISEGLDSLVKILAAMTQRGAVTPDTATLYLDKAMSDIIVVYLIGVEDASNEGEQEIPEFAGEMKSILTGIVGNMIDDANNFLDGRQAAREQG
jgi:hypothetical protein